MNNINKILCLVIIYSFTQSTYTASTPAQAFSRANCLASIPTQGDGKFNESVSYDLNLDSKEILTNHNMTVTTFQSNNCNSNVREQTVSNPNGYRARAGYVDYQHNDVAWFVEGTHVEILDNGSKVMELTSAVDCNLVANQFL